MEIRKKLSTFALGNTNDTMKKTNYKRYYATEENCFEGEKIGEFNNVTDAIKCMRENIADDVEEGEEVPDFDEEVIEGCIQYAHNMVNAQGYDIIYIITKDGRQARNYIARRRREII